jgi:CRISPR-associated protein Cst2
MNLFGTVLTYPAPSANYRGESELNRTTMQKLTDGRNEYPIISPEAMRNAMRETLSSYGLPMNRKRLHDEEQLAVCFESYPHPEKYADDFLFGYLVAASKADRKKILKSIKDDGRDESVFTFKRDSVLRMNLAKGIEPYRYSTVFTQSPMSADDGDNKTAYKNDSGSSLLHRETAETPFQYPFALNLNDCAKGPSEWTLKLLQAIGELNGVAGNHARSYFEMAPASIVVRLTEALVAGYRTYGFSKIDGGVDQPDTYSFPELIDGFLQPEPDYPASEFYLGGTIVKEMDEATSEALTKAGVTLDRNPQRLLTTVADKANEAMGAVK